ncbi:MAG TPA: metal ABC transporter substrate-binding protein [Kofleriaceae bacterium]|nr:metal ABC transporter substrate-binding protein [Kofleriaceae bacterium]
MRLCITTTTILMLATLGAGTASANVEVVATVPDLAALAHEVGGDKVSVTALALPTQDPHFVDAKPSLMLKLNKADVLVAVGLDLEVGWLPVLQNGARNDKILPGGAGYLDCSRHVRVLEAPSGPIDRSMGDIHPGGNPHYLFDPRQAAGCAKAIAAKLAAVDHANARAYDANLRKFLERLDQARAGWERRMAPFKGRPVITFHRSWTYLLDWLGLRSVAELEPKPGIPPTPSHVAEVLATGRANKVRCVIQESYYPDKTGRLVAKKLDGQLVTLPGGADVASGEGYIEHMGHVIDALEGAMK